MRNFDRLLENRGLRVFSEFNPNSIAVVKLLYRVIKKSVHLTITVQSSGAQRLFDHPVEGSICWLRT